MRALICTPGTTLVIGGRLAALGAITARSVVGVNAEGGNPAIDHLFADAYQPDNPVTGSATPTTNSAALTGSINPQGAAVNVAFQFGATTAYGQMTPTQTLRPSNSATAFAATVSGLAPATTFHYRAVAFSDFGTFVGADQVFTTSALPVNPPPKDTKPPTITLRLHKSTLNRLLKTRKLFVDVGTDEASRVNQVATTLGMSARKVMAAE